ncbi:hypothetical protein L2E82_20486 [Cichorium intybus]|uniref:Uncharacterized protein n=1 Tax=Cichorium intybus TaxID=13427 RepID=A0ACB9DT93_CICIN|nr:hypothetical protein L2E82_20486 [Cichorium intybus]
MIGKRWASIVLGHFSQGIVDCFSVISKIAKLAVRRCWLIAAIELIRNMPRGKYDAIIVDSSDPVGLAQELVERRFFESIVRGGVGGRLWAEQVGASKRVKVYINDLREKVANGGDPAKILETYQPHENSITEQGDFFGIHHWLKGEWAQPQIVY